MNTTNVPPVSYPPGPYGAPPAKKSKTWLIVLIVALALIVVSFLGFAACTAGVVGLAAVGSSSSPLDESAETYSQEPTDTAPVDGVADGTYRVGTEVKTGRYKTKVPADEYCYWERLKDTDGDLDSIIANGNVDEKVTTYVTIKKTDKYFSTDGCGAWQKVS